MRKVRLLALWLSLVVCIGRIDGKSRNDDEDDDEPSPPPKSSFRNPFASFGNDAAIWSPYLNYFPFGGFGSGARNAYRPYYATSPFLAGGYGPPGHRPIGPIMSGGRAVSGSNSYAAPPVGAYMPPYRPIGIGSRPYPASLSSSSPFMPYGPPPPYRSNPTASKEKDAFEEELAKLGINLADFGLDDKKEKKPANPPKSTPTINAGLSGSSAPISYNPFATTNTAPQVLPSSDGSSNYGSGKAIPDTSNSALDSDLANLGIDLTKFGIGTTRSPLEQFLNSATGGASMSGTPLRGHDGDMNQLSELNKLLAQLNGGTGNGASLSSSPNSVYPADSLHQQLNALRQPHLNDAITSPHHSHHSHHHSFPSSSHQGQSWNGQSRAVMPIFTHNDQYFRGEKKHLQNFKPFTGKVVNNDFFNSNKFDSARTKNDHQYNSNHDSKAEKYFESVRKEKDTETFSSGSKRYRGFKPILDYRPPIRTKSTSTSQRTRDAGEDDQSNDHESSKGRNKNRSKKITYQEEEEEYQDDAEHPRSNEGQRSKAPAVPYQHDRVGRKRPTVVPAEEPEYEEPSEERLPTIQGRSRSNHKEAHSFDYDDDLDDPYADRLKAMNHPDDGSNSANTVSTTHGTNEDSFTNDSKAYVKDANRESNHAESSSDQKLQNRSDTDGQTESSEKRESTTTLAAKHFASRSTGNVKGPTRKARQLGKAKKRWSNSELAEQTVDLLHLDQDKEEAGDEEFDVDDHRSKNGRLDVGLRAWKSAEKGTASSEAAKSRPRTKSDSQSKTWGPNDWSLFDDTVSTDSKKNWRQKSKSWKRNKMANRRSLFDRVYDEDNTDSIGQTMYKNF